MRNLSWFDKFLFFLNSLFAVGLLFSYLLPYIPPETFALLSVLSLGVPLLIMINAVFLIYWIIRMKKQLLLSLIALLFGINHITSIYEFSASTEEEEDGEVTIMSYNVRQFNQFKWSEDRNIPEKISDLIAGEQPEVLAMQEYYKGELDVASSFPHKYIKQKDGSAEFGLAIFSKYPIINAGSLDFPTPSNNNAIYADIVVKEDTLRFINVHLQSFSLKPNLSNLNLEKEESKRVFRGMGYTFVRQEEQMQSILDLINETPYEVVVLGDFNNTAYSYIYRELRSAGFNDAYKEEGNGFGRTFDFDYFPLRIDYIMPSEELEVTSFETLEVHYSDHFPIRATVKL